MLACGRTEWTSKRRPKSVIKRKWGKGETSRGKEGKRGMEGDNRVRKGRSSWLVTMLWDHHRDGGDILHNVGCHGCWVARWVLVRTSFALLGVVGEMRVGVLMRVGVRCACVLSPPTCAPFLLWFPFTKALLPCPSRRVVCLFYRSLLFIFIVFPHHSFLCIFSLTGLQSLDS